MNSFDQFFTHELSESLQPLEAERKKVAQTGIVSFLLAGITIVCFIIAVTGHSTGFAIAAFISLIPVIILLVIYHNRRKGYVASFKEKIIRRIINFIDPLLEYNPRYCIHENDYTKSGLFLQEPDRYQGDDYVEGKRDETFFCFSELHTEHKVGSGKNTSWHTIFKGIFFMADFNKNFSGRTYVWSEHNPQLNFFNKLLSSFAWDLEKIKLESTEFEKRFIVYGNDQVEARYILTPSFMERMIKLQGMMGEGISFSFVNTNINVAVPVKDELFEPSVFSPSDYQKLGDYYNTVHIVFDIIDELKLNQRLWNKE
ncbi:MAG: DUF3137 domain-containing protein [Chitinophagaceae bacterium]|nr:DUF3137 domain-containing protein [Chitinophagaceae bacterium]